MRRLARLGWTTLSGSCSKQVAAAEEAAGALLGRNATRGVASTGLAATEETASKGAAAAVMFVPSAVCACLAYWQYERMRWKVGTAQGVAGCVGGPRYGWRYGMGQLGFPGVPEH